MNRLMPPFDSTPDWEQAFPNLRNLHNPLMSRTLDRTDERQTTLPGLHGNQPPAESSGWLTFPVRQARQKLTGFSLAGRVRIG